MFINPYYWVLLSIVLSLRKTFELYQQKDYKTNIYILII